MRLPPPQAACWLLSAAAAADVAHNYLSRTHAGAASAQDP